MLFARERFANSSSNEPRYFTVVICGFDARNQVTSWENTKGEGT